MKPTEDEIVLYRKVQGNDILECYEIGDIIEIEKFSSTFIKPGSFYHRGYKPKTYCKYIITVPKGALILDLNRFKPEIRNESGEIILPPMKCAIKNVRMKISPMANGDWDFIYLDFKEHLIDKTINSLSSMVMQ